MPKSITLEQSSTWAILKHLYKRYECDILYATIGIMLTGLFLHKINVI